MLIIENEEVTGFSAALRGMRNPLNSWKRSDTIFDPLNIGPEDLKLMFTLRDAGTDHRKYLRMLMITVDITAPLYWWKEFDTYKVGTVSNSCSTMHTLHKSDLTIHDFSYEALDTAGIISLHTTISAINKSRRNYLKFKDTDPVEAARHWKQMIQLLPTSYNQKRTVLLNYEVLLNMYHSREHHKLTEWHEFCAWVNELPYSELITKKKEMKNK